MVERSTYPLPFLDKQRRSRAERNAFNPSSTSAEAIQIETTTELNPLPLRTFDKTYKGKL